MKRKVFSDLKKMVVSLGVKPADQSRLVSMFLVAMIDENNPVRNMDEQD